MTPQNTDSKVRKDNKPYKRHKTHYRGKKHSKNELSNAKDTKDTKDSSKSSGKLIRRDYNGSKDGSGYRDHKVGRENSREKEVTVESLRLNNQMLEQKIRDYIDTICDVELDWNN